MDLIAHLIEELGDGVRSTWHPDGDAGYWAVAGGWQFGIRLNAAASHLTFWSPIGRLEGADWLQERRGPWHDTAPFAEDGTQTLWVEHGPEGAAFLLRTWPREAMTASRLVEEVADYCRACEQWRSLLLGQDAVEPDAPDRSGASFHSDQF